MEGKTTQREARPNRRPPKTMERHVGHPKESGVAHQTRSQGPTTTLKDTSNLSFGDTRSPGRGPKTAKTTAGKSAPAQIVKKATTKNSETPTLKGQEGDFLIVTNSKMGASLDLLSNIGDTESDSNSVETEATEAEDLEPALKVPQDQNRQEREGDFELRGVTVGCVSGAVPGEEKSARAKAGSEGTRTTVSRDLDFNTPCTGTQEDAGEERLSAPHEELKLGKKLRRLRRKTREALYALDREVQEKVYDIVDEFEKIIHTVYTRLAVASTQALEFANILDKITNDARRLEEQYQRTEQLYEDRIRYLKEAKHNVTRQLESCQEQLKEEKNRRIPDTSKLEHLMQDLRQGLQERPTFAQVLTGAGGKLGQQENAGTPKIFSKHTLIVDKINPEEQINPALVLKTTFNPKDLGLVDPELIPTRRGGVIVKSSSLEGLKRLTEAIAGHEELKNKLQAHREAKLRPRLRIMGADPEIREEDLLQQILQHNELDISPSEFEVVTGSASQDLGGGGQWESLCPTNGKKTNICRMVQGWD